MAPVTLCSWSDKVLSIITYLVQKCEDIYIGTYDNDRVRKANRPATHKRRIYPTVAKDDNCGIQIGIDGHG